MSMRVLAHALPLVVALSAGCGSSDGGKTSASAEPSSPLAQKPLSLPGIDTDKLTPRERREFTAQVREMLAPCPEVPVSLAQCLEEKRACAACKPAADMLLAMVLRGVPKKDREETVKLRFDPKSKKEIDVSGSPSKGPEDAPVTIVEWADFECPFCRLMVPVLESLVERFPGQVRVVYKFYPLTTHKNGEPAARAAVAAMNQGKFWEAHRKLFDSQGRLEPTDLEAIAKALQLDVPKWRADLGTAEVGDRIKKDKDLADALGLEGTPMIFVDGREVPLESLGDPFADLESWVSLDLEMKGIKPAPRPAGFEGPRAPAGPAPLSSADLEALVRQLSSAAPASSGSAPPGASAASPGSSGKPGAAPSAPPAPKKSP